MAKRSEAELRVKNNDSKYIDAKLRFALLLSLRSVYFTPASQIDQLVVSFYFALNG
jgi:hypothetical protein